MVIKIKSVNNLQNRSWGKNGLKKMWVSDVNNDDVLKSVKIRFKFE